MNITAYPMLLTPDSRDEAWTGGALKRLFGRESTAVSMELAPGEAENRVENGPAAGTLLADLISAHPRAMVGPRHRTDARFPIRCSFWDVGQRTALEVHPAPFTGNALTDVLPRTKAWYVVAAESGATVTAGIRAGFSRHLVTSRFDTPELESMLQALPAEPGDAYFIGPGRVHSIGAGTLVFCVEQNEGDTLLVTDWGRADTPRSTDCRPHAEVTRAIHFQDRTLARIRGESSQVARNRKLPIVQNCPFFVVDEWRLVEAVHERTQGQSFHLITALEGPIHIAGGAHGVDVAPGRSCYIPAATEYYTITPIAGSARLLKTTLRTA